MKFVKVDEVPSRGRTNKNLQVFIDEFMSANIKIARIEVGEHEYKNVGVACSCLHVAIKRSGAHITVSKRGEEIYFIRRDM